MERRRFTREFKLEAVKLIKERGVSRVARNGDPGCLQLAVRGASSHRIRASLMRHARKPRRLRLSRTHEPSARSAPADSDTGRRNATA